MNDTRFIISLVYVYPEDLPCDIPKMTFIRTLRAACPKLSLLDAKNTIESFLSADEITPARWLMTGDQFTTFTMLCLTEHPPQSEGRWAMKNYIKIIGIESLSRPLVTADLSAY